MPVNPPFESLDLSTLLEVAFNAHVGGDLTTARAGYERVLGLAPEHAYALHALGLIALAQGAPTLALDYLQRAVAREPGNPQFIANLGVALAMVERAEDAVACHARAIALAPDEAEFHFNLGEALAKLNRFAPAAQAFAQAVARCPSDAQFHARQGSMLIKLDRFEEARASFEQAARLAPREAAYHYNLGSMWVHLGQQRAALPCFERALALKANDAQAHYSLSRACLAQGDFVRGWAQFEWRLAAYPDTYPNPARLPLADRETPRDTPVLVTYEQGYGDILQFCRFLPALAQRFPALRVCMPPALARLVGASFAGIAIEPDPATAAQGMRALLPLMSAPFVLGTTLDTLPARVPYLRVPEHARRAPLRLPATARRRVGLVWAGRSIWPGDAAGKADRRRSLPWEALLPLLDMPGIDWISLQLDRADDLTALRDAGRPLADFSADMQSYADTAALVEQLDLVISVDTSVAHLAGALAKPVWLLNRFDNCWRWLDGRTDSPWYPTMRIFRQTTAGDWAGVIARACAALQDESAAHS